MKNYNNTRAKIKNYLNALQKRFNNIQFQEYNREMTKEFGVSATIPGLLKNGNYIEFENKHLKLNPSINNLSEIDLHKMVLDYCNNSKRKINIRKEKQRARKLKKAEKLKQINEQSIPQTFTIEEINGKLKNNPEYTHFFKNKVGRPKSKIEKPTELGGSGVSFGSGIVNNETSEILKELLKNPSFAELYKNAATLNNCKNCNKSFKVSRKNNKYCSDKCRTKFHNKNYYAKIKLEDEELAKNRANLKKAFFGTENFNNDTILDNTKIDHNNYSTYPNPIEAEKQSKLKNELDVLETKLDSLDKLISLFSKGSITNEEMQTLKKAILS
jgi:hypothetical protein